MLPVFSRLTLTAALLSATIVPAFAAQSEATVATSTPKCSTFLIGDAQNHYILARTVGAVAAPAEDTPIRGDFSQLGIAKIETGSKGKGKLITIEILKIGKTSGDTVPAYMAACGQ